jgi:hypothetical protein
MLSCKWHLEMNLLLVEIKQRLHVLAYYLLSCKFFGLRTTLDLKVYVIICIRKHTRDDNGSSLFVRL